MSSNTAKREVKARKFTSLHYVGPGLIGDLDEEGRSLLWRSGDLAARFLLNYLSTSEYEARNFEGTASLIHAERYLADRLAYQLEPWPKGMVKDETINPIPPRCPHCDKLVLEPDWCSVCGKPFCCLNCTLDHDHEKNKFDSDNGGGSE